MKLTLNCDRCDKVEPVTLVTGFQQDGRSFGSPPFSVPEGWYVMVVVGQESFEASRYYLCPQCTAAVEWFAQEPPPRARSMS